MGLCFKKYIYIIVDILRRWTHDSLLLFDFPEFYSIEWNRFLTNLSKLAAYDRCVCKAYYLEIWFIMNKGWTWSWLDGWTLDTQLIHKHQILFTFQKVTLEEWSDMSTSCPSPFLPQFKVKLFRSFKLASISIINSINKSIGIKAHFKITCFIYHIVQISFYIQSQ